MAKKILLIDDEVELAKAIAVRLGARGYKVVVANDGSDGLLKAIVEKPDLIILDIMMPGINGLEVLRRLKDSPDTRDIPVIMLTCKGESQFIFKAQELDIVDYVIKPFDTVELLAVVGRCI